MAQKTTHELVKEACQAHTDLNVFEAVASLMESSLISSDCFDDEVAIVRRAKAAQRRCLRRLDKATAGLKIKPL